MRKDKFLKKEDVQRWKAIERRPLPCRLRRLCVDESTLILEAFVFFRISSFGVVQTWGKHATMDPI